VALAYLRTYYPDPPEGFLLAWTLSHRRDGEGKVVEVKRSLWHKSSDLGAVAAAVHLDAQNVYVQYAMSPADYGPFARCEAKDVKALFGLNADIDIFGPAHKNQALPPDLEAAVALARSMPLPPSLIVHSGHGIYPEWLFKEAWIFGTDADREEAKDLAKRWQDLLHGRAREKGWKLDATADLARVRRLPGSVNRKHDPTTGLPRGEPVLVTVEIPASIPRYDPKDIRDAVPEAKAWTFTMGDSPDDRELALSALAGLSATRAHPYSGEGSWLDVGMALHSVADDLLEPWDQWSRKSSKYKPGECAKKWKTFTRGGGLGLGSLIHWAKQDGWKPPHGKTSANGAAGARGGSPLPSDYTIGRLTLVPGLARRTPAKLSLPVTIRDVTGDVGLTTITSTGTGCQAALATLKGHLGDEFNATTAKAVLQKMLADAAQRLRDQPKAEGPTMRQVVEEVLRTQLQPRCRTPKGIWCEGMGRELTRAEFQALAVGDAVIGPASKAVDAPRAEPSLPPERLDMIRALETEAKAAWANWLGSLPKDRDVEMGKDTERAKAFWEAIRAVWVKPQTFERVQDKLIGSEVASNATLISRVMAARAKGLHRENTGWQPAHNAYAAWWRVYTAPDGEERVALAMRHELASQMKAELPGVNDQESLTRLGVQFGVVDPNPPVPSVLSHGTEGVAVLSCDRVDCLLAVPIDRVISPGEANYDASVTP
jgi:hypothetical protein